MDVKYDQHFLINDDILDKTIENSSINSDDVILEIGPGKGYLTKKILEKNLKKSIVSDENYLSENKQESIE